MLEQRKSRLIFAEFAQIRESQPALDGKLPGAERLLNGIALLLPGDDAAQVVDLRIAGLVENLRGLAAAVSRHALTIPALSSSVAAVTTQFLPLRLAW